MSDLPKDYTPPVTLGGVSSNIQFDIPLEPDDPRYVDTIPGRGTFKYSNLLGFLNIDHIKMEFMDGIPQQRVFSILSGHRGCGKSTELKRIAEALDKDDLFMVIFLDSASELDINNIQYADIFMALAKVLLNKLTEKDVSLDSVHYTAMESWFSQRILIRESEREYVSEIKTGLKGKTGIPFLCNLFAQFTAAFRNNVTYKDELRKVIKNNFSQFVEAFNQLIIAAIDEINVKLKRKSILFIIDGLDKLSDDDAKAFFIKDITQLQQVQGNFLYTGPIDHICSGIQIHQYFYCTVLPMIKIEERDGTRVEAGYSVLRDMIFRRADMKLFSSLDVVDQIIHFSGGNPRQVLQLLKYAVVSAHNGIFDDDSVKEAIHMHANNYKYFLTSEDYKLLHKIDHSRMEDIDQSDHTSKLLYELALLQYNDYWWKSHPVIRTLPGYLKYDTDQSR